MSFVNFFLTEEKSASCSKNYGSKGFNFRFIGAIVLFLYLIKTDIYLDFKLFFLRSFFFLLSRKKEEK